MGPALATHWANSIQEPTERIEATLNAFRRWIQTDKPAARSWAEQNGDSGRAAPVLRSFSQ